MRKYRLELLWVLLAFLALSGAACQRAFDPVSAYPANSATPGPNH